MTGQGTSSITVIWNNIGNKTLSLTFNDPVGCTIAAPTVKTIVVSTSPLPTISGISSICAGSSGVVYYTEPNMSNYIWKVTGGTFTTVGTTANIIEVTWTNAGIQTVTVNYSSGGCSAGNATVKTVTVVSATPPTISGFPAAACTGIPMYYSIDQGMTNYAWLISSGVRNKCSRRKNHGPESQPESVCSLGCNGNT